jgi:hypothetical protein
MKKIISLSLLIIFIFSGCGKTVQPPLYNWGNYVKSSSDYGMNGHNKEILEKHLLELEKIITESNEKDQRVAPGIYAEYAQILFETNKKEKANKYFLLEKTTYPMSSQFIDRVLIKLYGEKK